MNLVNGCSRRSNQLPGSVFVGICRLEIFDPVQFEKWVEKGMAPAIEPSLKLYGEILGLGFKIFLLTGRSETHRAITVENLINAGFQNWDKLILRLEMKLSLVPLDGPFVYSILSPLFPDIS